MNKLTTVDTSKSGIIERLREEIAELRRENFDLAAQLDVEKTVRAAAEDVIRVTAKLMVRA